METKPKVKIVYKKLQERLDRNPNGAPAAAPFFEILELLFGDDCAKIAASMPMLPASLEDIAARAGESPARTQALLDKMANRGIVMDMPHMKAGKTFYYLLPPVIGFFEFSMMRERDDFSQKRLAELMHSYENDSDAFAQSLFGGPSKLGRVLPNETAVAVGAQSEILDYERALEIIDLGGNSYALALCYCRHKMRQLDHACGKPEELCMSFGGAAEYFIRNGIARSVSKTEIIEKLDQARELGLVQVTDNVQQSPGFICNCCGCCCGMLSAMGTHGLKMTIHTSNFIASVADECTGCGKCVKACPVKAIDLVPRAATNDSGKPKKFARVDESICLGCGVCARACNLNSMSLRKRPYRELTPESSLEKILISAVENGKLEQILFDGVRGPSGDFLKTFVGAFLRMPAAKRLMLTNEVRSKFLDFANNAAAKK